jgi:chaperonin GroES
MISLDLTKYRPLPGRVVLKPDKPSDRYGAIIIPKTAKQDDLKRARVVAVGKGEVRDDGILMPVEMQVGDVVYYENNAAMTADKVKINGEEHLITRQRYIGAIEEA